MSNNEIIPEKLGCEYHDEFVKKMKEIHNVLGYKTMNETAIFVMEIGVAAINKVGLDMIKKEVASNKINEAREALVN